MQFVLNTVVGFHGSYFIQSSRHWNSMSSVVTECFGKCPVHRAALVEELNGLEENQQMASESQEGVQIKN